jgi:hypothetical protein
VSLGAGHSRKLADSGQLVLSGYLTARHRERLDDLAQLAASVGAAYTFQPVAGMGRTWYDLAARVTRLEHRDSAPRDRYLAEFDLSANRQLTARLDGRIGYRRDTTLRFGTSGLDPAARRTFDVAGDGAYAALDYGATPDLSLFAEYAWRRGGFTATVGGYDQWVGSYRASTPDHAFPDDCWPGACAWRYAVRTHADLRRLDVGATLRVGELHLDLLGRYYEADSDGVATYRNWLVQVGSTWYF